MAGYLLHGSLKGVRRLVTAEFAGGFDEAGGLGGGVILRLRVCLRHSENFLIDRTKTAVVQVFSAAEEGLGEDKLQASSHPNGQASRSTPTGPRHGDLEPDVIRVRVGSIAGGTGT